MENSNPRILIVRLSAIGDVIHGLPGALRIAQAMARRPPGLGGRKPAAPLIQNHPDLNWCRVVPRGWLKKWGEVTALRRDLRAQRFDMVLDLQGLTKSAIAGWLSGAPERIGFGGAEGREISGWFYTKKVISHKDHVIDKNMELLSAIDVSTESTVFNLTPSAEDTAKVATAVADTGVPSCYAVINPGAGWPSKRWPLERYSEVARHLFETKGVASMVVWAGNEERQWAEAIVRQAGKGTFLAPPTFLTELAAILKPATIFVGSDTGPLHIAVAVGTPCVGLYGPMPMERNGPYGEQHLALQKQWIHGTSRERRTASTEAMEAISVSDVTAACDRLLEKA